MSLTSKWLSESDFFGDQKQQFDPISYDSNKKKSSKKLLEKERNSIKKVNENTNEFKLNINKKILV
jgi:hypothetical protein